MLKTGESSFLLLSVINANLQHQVGFIKKAATLSCNNVEQFLLFLPFSPKYISVSQKGKRPGYA